MDFRIAFAPACSAARTFAVIAATTAFALVGAAGVQAQTPPPATKTPAPAKAQPKAPAG